MLVTPHHPLAICGALWALIGSAPPGSLAASLSKRMQLAKIDPAGAEQQLRNPTERISHPQKIITATNRPGYSSYHETSIFPNQVCETGGVKIIMGGSREQGFKHTQNSWSNEAGQGTISKKEAFVHQQKFMLFDSNTGNLAAELISSVEPAHELKNSMPHVPLQFTPDFHNTQGMGYLEHTPQTTRNRPKSPFLQTKQADHGRGQSPLTSSGARLEETPSDRAAKIYHQPSQKPPSQQRELVIEEILDDDEGGSAPEKVDHHTSPKPSQSQKALEIEEILEDHHIGSAPEHKTAPKLPQHGPGIGKIHFENILASAPEKVGHRTSQNPPPPPKQGPVIEEVYDNRVIGSFPDRQTSRKAPESQRGPVIEETREPPTEPLLNRGYTSHAEYGQEEMSKKILYVDFQLMVKHRFKMGPKDQEKFDKWLKGTDNQLHSSLHVGEPQPIKKLVEQHMSWAHKTKLLNPYQAVINTYGHGHRAVKNVSVEMNNLYLDEIIESLHPELTPTEQRNLKAYALKSEMESHPHVRLDNTEHSGEPWTHEQVVNIYNQWRNAPKSYGFKLSNIWDKFKAKASSFWKFLQRLTTKKTN